jgi:hypothetical protein
MDLTKKPKQKKLFYLKKTIKIVLKFFIKKLPSSIDGHYRFLTKNRFYHIVIKNKKFLREEKENIELISEKYNKIYTFVPRYKYVNAFNDLVIIKSSDILTEINDREQLFCFATQFLYTFRFYSKIVFFIDVHNLQYLDKGLNIIKSICDPHIYFNIMGLTIFFLSNIRLHIGFCHGDFHRRNIMEYNGKKQLLDFDCVREYSIQEFDAIYFIIQEIIFDMKNNICWFESIKLFMKIIDKKKAYKEFIKQFVNLNDLDKFLLLFFLDRLGQDSKYYKNDDWFNKQIVISTLKYLITQIENAMQERHKRLTLLSE